MPKNFDAAALKFVDRIVDKENGTRYHHLCLFHNDLLVASINYSDYRGTPTLHHISVPYLSDRRRGFATAIVQRLQQTYPDRQIGWLGVATRDGSAFYAALPKLEKQVKSVIDRKRHLAALIRQRDVMLLANPDGLSRSSLRELNELHANIDDLEFLLAGKSTICILIETKEAVPFPGATVLA